MPGLVEVIVLIAILVIVFGARRLPALGETIGRALASRRAATGSRDGREGQRGSDQVG